MSAGESLTCALARRFLVERGLEVVHRPSTRFLIRSSAPSDSAPKFTLAPGFFPSSTMCVVVEGFSVSTADGQVDLLGRGGSDQSATLLAALLGADVCEIWTDVTGVFTADPRTDPNARHIRQLSYDAVERMAGAGAKVLQAAAVAPARDAGVPIAIRCTFEPAHPGTLIVSAVESSTHDSDGTTAAHAFPTSPAAV